jgi:hypothetical protein
LSEADQVGCVAGVAIAQVLDEQVATESGKPWRKTTGGPLPALRQWTEASPTRVFASSAVTVSGFEPREDVIRNMSTRIARHPRVLVST